MMTIIFDRGDSCVCSGRAGGDGGWEDESEKEINPINLIEAIKEGKISIQIH